MTDHIKHENSADHGSFEHQDLKAANLVYFLLTLGVVTILCMFALRGVYAYLDKREKASQPAVSPLVTNVPEDTRHVAPGYPQSAFPSPKLEEDERGQLNGIKLQQDNTLYSYGWVDQPAGTVHIPIERAMDLLVQRGLPVRAQVGSADSGNDTATKNPTAAPATGANNNNNNKVKKK
ncbi:MAG: hypothetical protein WAL56_14565 [Candidatus Sulfotelmatobacter sp.]